MTVARALSLPERTVHWWLLGLTALAIGLLPRNAAALTALLCACVWVPALAMSRLQVLDTAYEGFGRRLVLLSAPIAWLVVTSATAANPWASFVGSLGQHAGALAWMVALLIFVTALLVSRKADIGRLMRAVGVLGAVLGGVTVLDSMTQTGAARFSALPAGWMENPISLAQVLVIAVACSGGWAISERSVGLRAAAVVSLLVSLAGLAVADSAGAWAGLLVGALVALVVWLLARRGWLHPEIAARVLAAVMVVGVLATLWVVNVAGSDAVLAERFRTVSHDRSTIWASAFSQIEQAPVAGSGAEQFSAWVGWDIDSNGRFTHTGTYDPHSLPLWWLLSGGFVGLALALAAAVSILARQLRVLADTRSPAVAAVIAALVGWITSATFAWSGTVALALCALLAGTFDAVNVRSVSSDRAPRGVLVASAALACCVALGLIVGGAPEEFGWARATDTATAGTAMAADKARSTGDPAYVSMVVAAAAKPGGGGVGATLSDDVLTAMNRDSAWHVDIALSRFFYEYAGVSGGTGPGWDPVAEAVRAGKSADPASGLWDCLAAIQAKRAGFDDEAAAHAAAATEHDLPPGAGAQIKALQEPAGR